MSESEATEWEKWRTAKITAELPTFVKSLQKVSASTTDENKLFILQELQLWAESIAPGDID